MSTSSPSTKSSNERFSAFAEKTTTLMQVLFAIYFVWILVQAVIRSVFMENTSVAVLVLTVLFAGAGIFLIRQTKVTKGFDSIPHYVPLILGIAGSAIVMLVSQDLAIDVAQPSWDFPALSRDAFSLAHGNLAESRIDYYAQYQNNQLMLLLITALYKPLTILHPGISLETCHHVAIFLHSLVAIGCYYMIFAIMKSRFGLRGGIVALLGTAAFTPLLLYSSIYYTDVIPMGIILLQLLLLIKSESLNGRHLALTFFAIGLLGGFGFELKATVIFFAICVFVYYLLFCKRGWRGRLERLVPLSLGIMTAAVAVGFILSNCFLNIPPEKSDQKSFPYTHWIMMSLGETGGWNGEDVLATANAGDKAAKAAFNTKAIKQRLEQRGIAGTANHLLITKTQRTWGNGNLAGSDYTGRSPERPNGLTHQIFSEQGQYFPVYHSLSQGYWIALLAVIALNAVQGIRRREPAIIWIAKATLVLFATFELIWECNSRYVVHMSGLLIIVSLFELLSASDTRISNAQRAPLLHSIRRRIFSIKHCKNESDQKDPFLFFKPSKKGIQKPQFSKTRG